MPHPTSLVRPLQSHTVARRQRVRLPFAGTIRTASSVGGGSRIICALLCATGTRSAGRGAIRSAVRLSCDPGTMAPMQWRSPVPKPTSLSSCSVCSMSLSLPSTMWTPHRKAGRLPSPSPTSTPSPIYSKRRWPQPRYAFSGERPTCSRTVATWRVRRPIRTRRCSSMPQARSGRRSR